MGISAVSSSSTTPQTQTDNGWQQFMQLAKAIQSGDTNAAQQAYTTFTQSAAGKQAASDPNSPLAQALSQIGQSLQSGDVSGAQQALASLKPQGHHHHHHHGGGGAAQAGGSAQPTVPTDPNAPGANVNVTA